MGDDRLVSVTSVPNRLNGGDQVVDSHPSSHLTSEVEDDGKKDEEWAIERIRSSPLLALRDSSNYNKIRREAVAASPSPLPNSDHNIKNPFQIPKGTNPIKYG